MLTEQIEKLKKRVRCNPDISDALREKFGRAELKINLGYQMMTEIEFELKRNRLWALPVHRKVKKKLTRNEKIKKLRKETTLTLQNIGDKYNLSAERIRQILNDK